MEIHKKVYADGDTYTDIPEHIYIEKLIYGEMYINENVYESCTQHRYIKMIHS